MSSILTNASALSALQSLTQTQSALQTTENQVSTGLAVSSAADNASYWSIATQLTSDSGVITAANSALTQSQSVLDTASSAISSIITTINSIQTALTQAVEPNADITNINTTLASLGSQLTDAVNGASFNGLNLLNGSQTAALNFVAGFNATTNGGTFNSIGFTAQALTATGSTTTTAQEPSITDAATINQITSLASNSATLAYGTNVITATAGTAGSVVIQSEALDGTITSTTYTAVDGNGNGTTLADAASLQVSTSTTTGAGLLTQSAGGSSFDLTNLNVTSATASNALTATEQALTAVTNYAATIGATQDRITNASNLNSQLTTNYSTGVAGLVDANMNTASTQLQALQTQEQLGIQSLSIANQNSQLILKLFS